PVAALSEGEAKLVQDWAGKGGKLVALIDPGVHSGLEKTFAAFGAKVGNDEVIDTESQQPQVAIAQDYADHPITAPRHSPFALAGNRDLAMNSVSWAAHEEAKISIRPRSRQANHLFLTAEQKHTMTLMAFDVLPFSLLFAGLLVWQTRKSR